MGLVVRLNNPQYEASRFTNNGIKHMELYYLDGSCPSDVMENIYLQDLRFIIGNC